MESENKKETELRALMIAGLKGDAPAHRALLTALSGHLRSYYKGRLNRAGHGPEEVEDLVQETLMAVHTKRHTYDPEQLLTPWVYAIARYRLIDYLRQRRPAMTNVPIEDAEELIAHDDQLASESNIDLEKLLARLSNKTRSAIQCVKLEGLSVVEAAVRCGVSESAIKVNVHRGIKALSKMISEEKSK
jgi:RNA polymerase sigma-70 factor, ECF subfamily